MVDKQNSPADAERLVPEGKIDAWPLPQLRQNGKVIISAQREREEKSKEAIETLSAAQRPRNLTAEDIKKISREAEEEGYKCGYEAGYAKGEIQGEKAGVVKGEKKAYAEKSAQLDSLRDNLRAIAEKLFEPMDRQEQEVESFLVDLAFQFGQQIVQAEISQAPDKFQKLIARALESIPAGSKNILVYLNPEDAEILTDVLGEKPGTWSIQVDASLASGGCRVETKESLVDYSLEKRWLNFLDAIEEADKDESVEKDSDDER